MTTEPYFLIFHLSILNVWLSKEHTETQQRQIRCYYVQLIADKSLPRTYHISIFVYLPRGRRPVTYSGINKFIIWHTNKHNDLYIYCIYILYLHNIFYGLACLIVMHWYHYHLKQSVYFNSNKNYIISFFLTYFSFNYNCERFIKHSVLQ